MAEMTKQEMLDVVESNISKLKNNEFNVYFFVLDTKGNPSSALEYIYQTAYTLKEMGYNVSMLHQEEEFIGVSNWLGEKYANIPHYNIEKENVEITPSDFLFIPEIFANVMIQTKKLPCKRVAIVQNYKHITEFMPVYYTLNGNGLHSLGISDVIATTDEQAKRIKEYFPEIRTHVVHPSIKKMFRNNDEPRKLIVNVISREQSKANEIVKPFYWKNPIYKFITFRDLRGMNQEEFSECLRDAAITVWEDDDTQFGYTLLEALRCGSVVLAKIPEKPVEWMLDENGELTSSIIWFENNDDIHKILASVIRSWTLDLIPEEVYESQKKLDNLYTEELQKSEIDYVYVQNLFNKRLKEFEEVKADVENNVFKTKEE